MAQNKRPYSCAGHYTKDENQNLVFISGFFQIMSDKNLTYLRPTQFKLCQKIGYRFFNLYQKSATVAEIFENLFKMSPQIKKQDQTVSAFVANFVKPQLEERYKIDKEEAEALLPFIFETLLPKTLNCLGVDADYITDMSQQIQASLNLLLNLKLKYKDHELYVQFSKKLSKKEGLLDQLLLAFQTAHDALDTQMANVRKAMKPDEAQVQCNKL